MALKLSERIIKAGQKAQSYVSLAKYHPCLKIEIYILVVLFLLLIFNGYGIIKEKNRLRTY